MATPTTLWAVVYAKEVYRTANLLHPKKEAAEELTQQDLREDSHTAETGEMKVFHRGKLTNMWNETIGQHMSFEGRCERPHFEVSSEQQGRYAGGRPSNVRTVATKEACTTCMQRCHQPRGVRRQQYQTLGGM